MITTFKRTFATLSMAAAVTAAFSTFATPAFAEDEVVTAPMGPLPLNTGNWEVGGTAAYTRNVRTNDRSITVAPKGEYFFANRFSAGGTAYYSDSSVTSAGPSFTAVGTTWGLGPSATYYITHTERTALSIDQSILYSKPSAGDNYVQGATGVAFDVFLTQSIAFGPSLRAYYYFNGGIAKPDDAVRLGFDFSLFL